MRPFIVGRRTRPRWRTPAATMRDRGWVVTSPMTGHHGSRWPATADMTSCPRHHASTRHGYAVSTAFSLSKRLADRRRHAPARHDVRVPARATQLEVQGGRPAVTGRSTVVRARRAVQACPRGGDARQDAAARLECGALVVEPMARRVEAGVRASDPGASRGVPPAPPLTYGTRAGSSAGRLTSSTLSATRDHPGAAHVVRVCRSLPVPQDRRAVRGSRWGTVRGMGYRLVPAADAQLARWTGGCAHSQLAVVDGFRTETARG